MAPRLAHRKSRAGCRRCKERKVKCNEQHPSCSACLRHGVTCEYTDAPVQAKALPDQSDQSISRGSTPVTGETTTGNLATRETPTSTQGQTPLNGPDTPYSDIAGSLALTESRRHALELFLLHRFTFTVATTFPSFRYESTKLLYTHQAPSLACDNRFLFDTIFAVTALHICKTVPSPKIGYTEQDELPETFRGMDFAQLHRIYLNQAIRKQREAISSLGPSNSDAIGLTSVLLSIMATCLLPEAEGSGEIYKPPIQWLRMASAVAIVFQAAAPHVRPGSIMMTYFQKDRKPSFADSEYLFNPSHTNPFKKLLEFQASSSTLFGHVDLRETDPLRKETCRLTLALVGSIHTAIREGEPSHYICQRVTSFAPLCPTNFIDLLADKKPLAMLILAHYMAMMKHLDEDFWWFKGRPERDIYGIQSILPEEWQWGLAWPLAVLTSPLKAHLDPKPFQIV
ncbi:hypothetical protein LTR84_011467 [Exophiala bonariae]|uniref:Zn(2)-C6 fungal-type domain-containing protein n=1 Tax=Exophiala bonariae TaxID=1690606 RepID=A0AAV9NH62_9EURO|nr:hypothetical protein LTR84_011467 [Exophiala bonariae]